MRVSFRGRLVHLDHRFSLDLRPLPGRRIRYRWVKGDERPARAAKSAFGEFLPFRIRGGWPLAGALTLTEKVRTAVMRLADEPIPAVIHGHDDSMHCAYVPLPFVGVDHADSSVLGFAVVLPRGVSWPERQAVFCALGKLRYLRLPGRRVLEVEPVDAFQARRTPYTLTAWRWCSPARVWASVTPVVFDRIPRRRYRPVEALTDSCRFVGLPTPRRVTVSQVSPLRGVPHSRDFRIRRRLDEPPRYVAHAILEFDQPVEGPVLLGAGRYFGLGFFAPVPAAEEVAGA